MNGKRVLYILVTLMIAFGLVAADLADDGVMFRRNISKTPDGETEKAGISMMYFYVPAQAADGTLLTDGITYLLADGVNPLEPEARLFTKPLTAVYIDEEFAEDEIEIADENAILGDSGVMGGIAMGDFDAFSALSLDDGASWKSYNLSRSAHLSSFTLANGHDYPGAAHSAVQVTAGNRIMVAWISRYCDGGNPLYTYTEDSEIPALQERYSLPDLYVYDAFGVQGTQKSVDYTLQGFPEIGEIPYGCVWTARGMLVPSVNDTGEEIFEMLWTKPERLTSGKRDPNRLEIDARPGGGFVITWQEDPEGLRPGQGLGPGEGWSGAIVNSKTDIWYSYIGWEDFNLLDPDADVTTADALTMEEYLATYPEGTMPKIEVPMALPVRLTDNNQCKAAYVSDPTKMSDPYCYLDLAGAEYSSFEITDNTLPAGPVTDSSLCTGSIPWDTNGGSTISICQAEDGRVFTGRVGASRPRVGLYPVVEAVDDLSTVDINEASTKYYVVMAYEELKALGDLVDEEENPIDIGKNIWYHSFDMFNPDLVSQGGMLNQPTTYDPETGVVYDLLNSPEMIIPLEDWGAPYFHTEIARRFSLVAQTYENATQEGAETGTMAFLIYKQGIINQGGPADVFARRIILPEGFDPAVSGNPYAFENMECANWALTDGTNHNYLQGVCLSPAVNFSGTHTNFCDTDDADPISCTEDFPWDFGTDSEFPKVTSWYQTAGNLDDQSWENPFDVSKGHRGFLDGDFLMVLYAWAPNWKANSVGNDHYNLYVRRSFDGGQTFTTTPTELGGIGTESCENFGTLSTGVTTECTTYDPGVFEQARNVSQLIGNKVTVLDPRYTPTGGLKMMTVKDSLGIGGGNLPYWDDAARDPSKFFIIYETGDNTTVAEGEAVPLDLFHSRGTLYGDDYDLVEYTKSDGTLYEGWGWVENQKDDLSGEAGMTASPMGTFMYTVWNQWQELEEHVITASDIMFRRILYNDLADAEPVSTILSEMPTILILGDTLDLYGTGHDGDHKGDGIVSYKWMIGKKGSELQVHNGQNLSIKTGDLGLGDFIVTFSVLDDEGNWSYPVTYEFSIWAGYYEMHIPLVRR